MSKCDKDCKKDVILQNNNNQPNFETNTRILRDRNRISMPTQLQKDFVVNTPKKKTRKK